MNIFCSNLALPISTQPSQPTAALSVFPPDQRNSSWPRAYFRHDTESAVEGECERQERVHNNQRTINSTAKPVNRAGGRSSLNATAKFAAFRSLYRTVQ